MINFRGSTEFILWCDLIGKYAKSRQTCLEGVQGYELYNLTHSLKDVNYYNRRYRTNVLMVLVLYFATSYQNVMLLCSMK